MQACAVWLIVVLAAAWVGCDESDEPGPLRVSLLVWPPYELALLARERGYFDADRVRLLDYRSPAEVMRAYRNGTVDAIAVTTHYLVQLEAQFAGNVAVFVINVSDGGDSVLAREPGRLAGKRVGVEASALGPYLLDRALAAQGLKRDDVTLVAVDVHHQEQAFRNGKVDAVVTYEPTRSRLLAAGAVEIFDSSRIPNEIVDVLVVREEQLDERRAQLRELIDGWLRARADFVSEPLAAARVVAARERLSPAAFVAAMKGAQLPDRAANVRLLSSELTASTKPVVEHALAAGIIDERIDLAGSFTPSLVDAP